MTPERAAETLEAGAFDALLELDWERRAWRLRSGKLIPHRRSPAPARRPLALSLDGPRTLGLGAASRALRELPARSPLRARLLMGLGRVEEAWLAGARAPLWVGDFEAAAALRGAVPLAHAARGEALRLLGRAAEARRALDAAVPAGARALVLRARLTGEKDLERALALEPGSVWALMELGWLELSRGRTDAAAGEFARAAQARPSCAWAFAWQARALAASGRASEAAAARARAVRLEPSCVWSELDSWDGAPASDLPALLVECGARLEKDPHDAAAWALRGDCRDQHAHVVADLSRAVELEPSRPWFRGSLARALLYQGRADEADAQLAEAIRLDPRCGWLYAWRGEVRRRQERAEEARADQDRAIALAPDYPRGWIWRGGLRAAAGDLEGALADFDAGLELDPAYAYGLTERAAVLEKLGRTAAAREDRAAAARLDERLAPGAPRAAAPDPWRAWPYAQECAAAVKARRPRAALEAVRRFRALSIKDCGAAVLEARLARAAGRPEEAAHAAAAACLLDPEDAWARQELALALLWSGEPENAYLAQRDALRAGAQRPWRFGYERRALLESSDPFEDALAALSRAPARVRGWAGFWRAWLLGSLGREKEARAARSAAARGRGPSAAWAKALSAGTSAELAPLARSAPRAGWLAARLGSALAREGDARRAAAEFDRALALDPGEDEALLGRAELRAKAGRTAEALADVDAALALDGRRAWLLRRRAELLESLGRLKDAERDLTRALDLHAGYEQARADLSRVRERLEEPA